MTAKPLRLSSTMGAKRVVPVNSASAESPVSASMLSWSSVVQMIAPPVATTAPQMKAPKSRRFGSFSKRSSQ